MSSLSLSCTPVISIQRRYTSTVNVNRTSYWFVVASQACLLHAELSAVIMRLQDI